MQVYETYFTRRLLVLYLPYIEVAFFETRLIKKKLVSRSIFFILDYTALEIIPKFVYFIMHNVQFDEYFRKMSIEFEKMMSQNQQKIGQKQVNFLVKGKTLYLRHVLSNF